MSFIGAVASSVRQVLARYAADVTLPCLIIGAGNFTVPTEKEARRMAKEIISIEYEVIDEIWNRRRVKYASVAADYDQLTIKEINRRMPNLLVKNGGVALDELAQEYHFSSTCDLIDVFVNYTRSGYA